MSGGLSPLPGRDCLTLVSPEARKVPEICGHSDWSNNVLLHLTTSV